jgi:hypothetical protein
MREGLNVEALVPEFEHEGVTYYFPKADFDNGTAREYALADEYYNAFATDQEDTDALLLLTSALARPMVSAPNFSREIVESRLESFKKLPFEVVLIALRYFEALKKEVYELGIAVELFEPLNEESDEETEGKDEIIEFGWWTSYRYIAKSQVFGNFNGVCDSLFWDVFKYLIEEKQRENIAKKPPTTHNQ